MSSKPPSFATLSQRLTSLSSLILERSRVISLGLPASASTDSQIIRGLTIVRDGMARVQDEIEIERSGLTVGAAGSSGRGVPGVSLGRSRISFSGQGKEMNHAALKGLGDRYDRVIAMMETDDVGRSKIQGLKRVIPESAPISPRLSSAPHDPLRSTEAQFALESPSSSRSSSPTHKPSVDRFRDDPIPGPSTPRTTTRSDPFEDPLSKPVSTLYDDQDHPSGSGAVAEDDRDERSEQQLLQNQRELMNDQDQRLSLLSTSISRQNHLSIQIGSELDLHSDLLDDTELAMDRTHDRLNKAKGRLDKVAKGAKAYGSTITIVVLILILLILIIAFKT